MSSTAIFYTVASVVLVSLFSLVGIVLLLLRNRVRNYVTILIVSFSSGSLFGDAFIHLLPEAVGKHGFTVMVSLFTLCGIAGMFVVEKIIHWRHVHYPEQTEMESFAYMNLLGDAVHNLLDGVVIAAAYAADLRVGIATTIAILFHEIPQEMGDFGVLIHGGVSRGRALFFNLITALTALAGAAATIFLINMADQMTIFLIPFRPGLLFTLRAPISFPNFTRKKLFKILFYSFYFFSWG